MTMTVGDITALVDGDVLMCWYTCHGAKTESCPFLCEFQVRDMNDSQVEDQS